MLSLRVIDTDHFLEMPLSTQAVYLHLVMRADDDGFVANPKRILRMVGGCEDDLRLLITKSFVFYFDTGVCVIKHWRIHNLVRGDRYTPTMHKYERSLLEVDNGQYERANVSVNVIPEDIPAVGEESYQMAPQVRLGKGRLGKTPPVVPPQGEDATSPGRSPDPEGVTGSQIIALWGELCPGHPQPTTWTKTRASALKGRLKEDRERRDLAWWRRYFESIAESDFLSGRAGTSKGPFFASLDWVMKPTNMVKILEGNYANRANRSRQKRDISRGVYRTEPEFEYRTDPDGRVTRVYPERPSLPGDGGIGAQGGDIEDPDCPF
ncbi:MAG: hypothetical protein EOM02_08600 [Synergistales bacterium]|nr:hypothetical protein [Synergistales bacterium]